MNPCLLLRSRAALLLILTLTLAACGGETAVKEQPAGTPEAAEPSDKPGGYYLDDGPGDNPPPNIDGIPDAVPKYETPLARANRPYTALGVDYTPMTGYQPYKQRGVASWYGKRYHGQKTSSGEIYDMYGMTAAHTTLPLPSYARVTNPENGLSVIVRINDRGPFHSDRLIDLSYAAAYKLRLSQKGSGEVIVEAIDTRNEIQKKLNGDLNLAIPPPPPPPVFVDIPSSNVPVNTPPPANKPRATASASLAAPVAKSANPATAAGKTAKPAPNTGNGNYLQLGVFKQKENADRLSEALQQRKLTGNTPVESWYNNGVYRVRVGPYADRQEAEQVAARIKQTLGISAILNRQ